MCFSNVDYTSEGYFQFSNQFNVGFTLAYGYFYLLISPID